MKYIFNWTGLLAILWLASCHTAPERPALKEGGWRGALTIVDSTGLVLPFRFDYAVVNDSARITIFNAEERIVADEISFSGDSIFIRMPVFDSEFRCRLSGDSAFSGNWINYSRKDKNIIPFAASYGTDDIYGCPEYDKNYPFEGRWKCLFSPNEPDSAFAVGIFKPEQHKATGTFLTETGDYRFLEGCVFGNYLQLFCFDGSHAFIFHAQIMEDSTIWGEFYSGLHHQETWLGWKDEQFKLRHADSLTYLKPGTEKIDFSFPNLENKKVSLSDEKFKNKVVLVQIMGSWCPNCMDETKFLTGLYNKYKDQGLEVVALGFEKAEAFEKAATNMGRLRKRFGANYDFLVTGFLPKDADKAMPMLNHVMSFPTLIMIDKKGTVRKIRTGYSGPATGAEHTRFTSEIEDLTVGLLKE